MNLHRAIASSRRHNVEYVVFADVPFGAHAGRHIEQLLCLTWQVTPNDLDIYNVHHERDVMASRMSSANCGDSALFETGWGHGRAFYCQPEHTQFLVGPATLQRLRKAQAQIIGQGYEQYLDNAAKGLPDNYKTSNTVEAA